MSSCTRISTSVRSSPPRALYFCVRLYSANHQGLPIVLLVLAPQGFVLLRTSVRCASQRPLCGASLQRLYTVCARACVSVPSVHCTSPKSFARCEPRLCASVYRTSAKSFARCEPTKALWLCVLYEPHELFSVQGLQRLYTVCARACASGTVRTSRALCGASLQRLYTVCWCSPSKLCTEYLCARAVV